MDLILGKHICSLIWYLVAGAPQLKQKTFVQYQMCETKLQPRSCLFLAWLIQKDFSIIVQG